MRIEAQAGPQLISDGAVVVPRLGRLGDLIVSELNPRYYEQGGRGNMFVAANSAATTPTTGLSATASGLVLTNPTGSGYNLAIVDFTWNYVTIPVALSTIVLAANVNPAAAAVTHTTPLVVRKYPFSTAGVGVGLADSLATVPAVPVTIRNIVTFATAVGIAGGKDEIGGAIVLAPGTAISTQNTVGTPSSMLFSLTWVEIPI